MAEPRCQYAPKIVAALQVEAFYDHGRLEFAAPLQLGEQRIRVLVTLPDDAFASPASAASKVTELASSSSPMLGRIEAVLGQHFRQRPESSVERDRGLFAESDPQP